MDRIDCRFIELEVSSDTTRLVAQFNNEPRDGIGTTMIKIKNIDGEPPIKITKLNEKEVQFTVVHDCHLAEGNYQDVPLHAGDFVIGYPNGEIEVNNYK